MGVTRIEWAEAVWNPVTGCSAVSDGCARCYARRMATRLRGRCGYPADDPFRVTTHPDRLREPLAWRKPRRIFVCSMGDMFHESVPYSFVDQVMATIAQASHHTYMVLTKRPRRMAEYFAGRPALSIVNGLHVAWPPRNLWLGTSCEDQAAADERIPWLLQTPSVLRFLSCEPLLGRVQLPYGTVSGCHACCNKDRCTGCRHYYRPDCPVCHGTANGPHIHWLIAGGESGPNARPFHPDWVRSLRDQCQASGVPFLFKQWGEWAPGIEGNGVLVTSGDGSRSRVLGIDGHSGSSRNRPVVVMIRCGKKAAGRMLDGREWMEFPDSAPPRSPRRR